MEPLEIVSCGHEHCDGSKPETKVISQHYMLHYIEDGEGYFNGKLLHKGEGFLCRKTKLVSYYPNKDNPWTYIWINFRADAAAAMLEAVGIPSADDTFRFDEALPYIRTLCETDANHAYDRKLFIASAFYKLLAYHTIDSNCSPDKKNSISVREKYVELAKAYIEDNLQNTICAKDVAQFLKIDRAYLRNIFTTYSNTSPSRYIMACRMQKAAEIFKMNRLPVNIVAYSVGFTDPMFFSKCFKKYFGCTPTQYKIKFEMR